MCKKTVFTNHRFVLEGSRIKCAKCTKRWDMEGRELTQGLKIDSLSPREVARVLVKELIHSSHLQDRAEIRALFTEATQTPELFIEDVIGPSQA